MSSMGFPTSPSDGDIYRKWKYVAATTSWTLHGVAGVTGDLGVLTINGQIFDPALDSDLSITVSGAGNLGVLTIDGKAFDPALDSDLSVTTGGSATLDSADLGILTINGKAWNPAADSDVSLTLSKVLTITYASSAPVSNGVEIGDEYYITSDGTSSGTVSVGYVWNGTTWTEQLTQVDGSASGSDF